MAWTVTKIRSGLFTGVDPGVYPNFAVYTLQGDDNYGTPEIVNLSEVFSTIDYISAAVDTGSSGFLNLHNIDLSDAGDVEFEVWNADWSAQVAGGTNLTTYLWKILVWGQITIT